MTTLIALLTMLVVTLPLGAGADEHIDGSFTAIAAPMPWPLWDDQVGHRCNAGVPGVHKAVLPFTAPYEGLLTLSAEGFIGDWDLFITDAGGGFELGSSNRSQQAISTTGSERVTTLVAAGRAVEMIACNQLGAPIAEIDYTFEPFDPATIAVVVGIGDDGGASNYYDPTTVTIRAGEAVGWEVVTGRAPHTVTGEGDSFRGGTVTAGWYARTFSEPGTYPYFCEFHGAPGGLGQSGTVVVTP